MEVFEFFILGICVIFAGIVFWAGAALSSKEETRAGEFFYMLCQICIISGLVSWVIGLIKFLILKLN